MGSPQRGVRAAACNAGAPRLIDGEEVLACMPLSLLRTAPETLVNAAKRGKKKKGASLTKYKMQDLPC